MLGRCWSSLLRRYSTFLYDYPFIFLILTPLFLIVCVLFSFVPAVGPDFPDFSKPTEGFEPRGTEIMKRVVTHQETFPAALKNGELSCRMDSRTRKRRSTKTLTICPIKDYKDYSIKTVYESDRDLFNVNDLQTICSMDKRIIRDTPEFKAYCSCPIYQPNFQCGPSLSLGTYIASIRNRSSCSEITKEDVSYAKEILNNCAAAYFSENLTDGSLIVENCWQENKTFVNNVFDLLVDTDFMRSTNILKNTMVLSPAYYDVNFARDMYDQHFAEGIPEQSGVKMVAFEFGDFKFDQFSLQLLLDAVFPAIGLVMIAVILLVYTHSILVMALTVFSVITSVIIAYFIYHHVFRLTFFPFLNILTFIFLVGIGADDAFVFSDVWSQAKLARPDGGVVDWIEYTLSHAALSMFVTSFTTSAAFYANVVSDITAIRLFGIYSGTSILIMYSLMITWFPAGIVFAEKRRERRRHAGGNAIELHGNPAAKVSDKIPPDYAEPHGSVPSTDGILDNQPPARASPLRYYSTFRSKCSRGMRNLFEKWIPASLRGYPIWLVVFLALGIGMACAMTVSPGLQRPKSSDFQVFSSSHFLEQYELNYKNKFRLELTEGNFRVYIFLGFKAEDNGNHLEPTNFGKLEFDDSFDLLKPEAQKWLMEDLCSEIKKQSFFEKDIYWSCYTKDFKDLCKSSKNFDPPLNETELTECIQDSNVYRPSCDGKYSRSLFFQDNKPKGLSLAFPTNIQYTNDYETVDKLWSDIQDFTSSVLDKAPEGLQNGWATSWLRFYALQRNLGSGTITSLGVSLAIAFVVMLLTSLNWVISLYAILTIICILASTIGSLVLSGWELNILESIVMSVAVGLSVDFTLHYGVAYTISSEKGRVDQVKYALGHIGPAVTLAAITTFIAGVFMMFSTVLAYSQLGQFLTLVMAMSWLFATFFFMSLCYFAGPVGHFGQINSAKCLSCKIAPEK